MLMWRLCVARTRQPELAALLDGEAAFFPAGPFAGEDALGALQRLGLRARVDPPALLGAARHVAELAPRDPGAAHARCPIWLSITWTIIVTRTSIRSYLLGVRCM